jgi:hypothetical protein
MSTFVMTASNGEEAFINTANDIYEKKPMTKKCK